MGPAGVVVSQERRQPCGTLCTVVPDSPIGPLAQTCLDEAFSIPVGLRSVGPSKGVLDAQGPACIGKRLGAIGAPVVGQQTLDTHAQGAVVGHRLPEELHRRAGTLVLMDLYKASTRMIVYGHMRKLPAHA